jgi:hypothetical protein
VSEPSAVEVSDALMDEARKHYPAAGSADGKPTLWHFVNGPLAAAREYFSREFDTALQESPESPIRYWVTISTFFPVLGFFAARVGDHIEILSYMVDDSYWDLVDDDPGD